MSVEVVSSGPPESSGVPVDPGATMADIAYAAIRDKLVMLTIKPGDAVVESALSAELGVGRTPVREALKRLEYERLVVSHARRGTFATSVDVADLGDISEIRRRLEPLAAAKAAVAASATQRQLLLGMADRTDKFEAAPPSRYDLIEWDAEVHRTVYRLTSNPILEDALIRYNNLATRIFWLLLDRLPPLADHVGTHAAMLRAIAAGDAEDAAAIARAHVTEFDEAVRAVI
ncbi:MULTISPECIES: GntR family transcriptional regulator [Nocardiaceae]|uniref:GntR family transcriptional regulator n=1 Tax=Rhodococcoides yunnanense TaxID=278209 RepID=A0ABU4B9P8_9NOCA|nr:MULTISPECIES: GntR family transcriptional regulator [Rhodococcus]MDI9893322.1 GntR family transcriptional regulator [Rhodococcus sp. IEGM 1381]MDV6260931.1 GntR family transcriptional regulator [Rhodococcus yunnanensis]